MTLDRYVIRQTLAPTVLALLVFTFLLAINPMLDYLKDYFAKGLSLGMVAYLLGQLVWQALGQALPMALLTGILISLGRMSADREGVAMLASGVSPLRLLRGVLALGLVVGVADFYVLAKAVPDGNQRFREVTFPLVMTLGERDIKPGVFFEQFPGLVVYVREHNPTGGWNGVLLAETAGPGPPVLTLAAHGQLVLDHPHRVVRLLLKGATQYVPGKADSAYSVNAADATDFKISPELIFGSGNIMPGIREKRIPQLLADIEAKRARRESAHPEIIQLHQMFAFPVAALVFALVALGLGLNTRRDGKFASLALGLGVIIVYYAFLVLAESRVKGDAAAGIRTLPAAWARWVPNIALTLIGILAIRWRMRGPKPQSAVARFVTRLQDRFRKDEELPVPATIRLVERPPIAPRRRGLTSWIFPRLLDQYVGGRYWKTIALTFVGLLFLVYVFTFLDLSDKIFKGQADGWMFARFLWFSTPQYVVLVLPFSTLLATLATMGALARTSELTVMRAAGVSLYRTALPIVLGACVLSVALFMLDERVLATSNQEARRLEDAIRGRPTHTLDSRNQSWHAEQDRSRVYHFAAFDERTQSLLGLSVFEFTVSPFRLTSHTYVNRATHGPDGWRADTGWVHRFDAAAQARTELSNTAIDLAPIDDFRSARVDPRRLSFRELLAYNRKLGAAGFNVREHEVNLHRKIAFPFAAIILTILAVPLGAVAGRHGALYGMGLAIVLAVIYFLAQTLFLAAGTAAMLPTPLAAWGANLLFLSAAVYMLLTVRT